MTAVTTVAPSTSEKSGFVKEFRAAHPGNPMKTWLVFEMTGVLVGGFLSGAFAGRLKLKVEHSPKITSRKKTFPGLTGGTLFGFGSQLGRGCTSGVSIKWDGSTFSGRIHNNDGHLRNCLCTSIFLQEELDIRRYKV